MGGQMNTRFSQRTRPRQQSTGFGELETTPTSRHLQSPHRGQPQKSKLGLPNQDSNPEAQNARLQSRTLADEFENSLNDADVARLASLNESVPSAQPHQDFSWSEGGSTHRSSPVREDEQNLSENQELAIDEFSSPKSGPGKLPNTQPLPSQPLTRRLAGEITFVDFSETASSARRSSPYYSQVAGSQAAVDETWNITENTTLPVLPSEIPESLQIPDLLLPPYLETMGHLPEDELYDATPPRSSTDHPADSSSKGQRVIYDNPQQSQDPKKLEQPQTLEVKRNSGKRYKGTRDSLTKFLEDELGPPDQEREGEEEEKASSSPPERTAKRRVPGRNKQQAEEILEEENVTPAAGKPKAIGPGAKGKKRGKQRAKPPIPFDEETQQVKDIPQQDRVKEPKRMTIVRNLRESYAASVSPIATSVKKASPRANRKVIAKPAGRTTRRSGLRSAVNQEDSDTTGKVHKQDTSITLATQVVTEPPPTVERITRAHDKKEKSFTSKPRGRTNIPETRDETQELTQEPIVLSSDPDSSPLSEDNSAIPVERLRPSNAAPPEKLELPVGSIPQLEPSDSVYHDEEQSFASPPKRPEPSYLQHHERNQPVIQKKTLTIRPDPKDLAEGHSPRNRISQPIRIGPGEVLSARDANSLIQRDTSRVNAPKRSAMTTEPVLDVCQPVRKARKLSRSFSISQAGSPLPVETLSSQLVDEAIPYDMEGVEYATAVENGKQKAGPRRSYRLRTLAD
ncbi:hypothetical protein FHETE_1651 [Fusarium heterosporum]|uniref:Uncharacterized protein n=1 Tax=Fusarium heterosporum TaxID=42747 RepID=A0A8H5X0B2_FUSHE|nr:hypothetical protein FHETE_1651 [Fusarium heterosporum]